MSLHDRKVFERHVLRQRGAEIAHQWGGASVGKVGGKIFAIHSYWRDDEKSHVSFKCSDLSFELLPGLEGITAAKYLARAKWVDVAKASVLSDDEIAAYIVEAHRLVVAKLPKRVRAELGLD